MASEREWSNEMREDDLDHIDSTDNILLDELECEKNLKRITYDWSNETASRALFKGKITMYIQSPVGQRCRLLLILVLD